MRYQQQVRYFLIALAAFVALNVLIWKLCTERLLTDHWGAGGDLARTGYLTGAKYPRQVTTDLPEHHLEFSDYNGQPIDVLTVGDSFSNGQGGGKNRYYQDYIASLQHLSVLNLGMFSQNDGPVTTLIALLNSSYLDRIKPRIVLLQSVERFAMERLGHELRFDGSWTARDITRFYATHRESSDYLPPVSFINTANMKYLYYNLLYRFTDSPTRKVIARKLAKPFFSVPLASTLLFWHDDVRNIPRQTPDALARTNANLNRLADLLAQRGITLYFMPVVDKYDLYCDYIIDNPYPRSHFFEELRRFPKRYVLIDTKAILGEAVQRGEKDIYYADDTHWSWKASEMIFTRVQLAATSKGAP